ncbi:hypothetical protein [Sphingomonas sp.]|uniref:hypothetical protein n=1 Tax=Sphingomonas sp. TaxID=28214 RepID=UPI0035C7A577
MSDATDRVIDYMDRMDRKRGYGELTIELQRTLAEAIRLRKADRNDPRARELMLRADQINQERALTPL